jgi:hypothetical protein
LRPVNTSIGGGCFSAPFARSTLPASFISVFVDGARSAEPPATNGASAAIFWITCPDSARVATALSDFAASSSDASNPSGIVRDQ